MDNQIQENSMKSCFSFNSVDKSYQTIFSPQYAHYDEDTLHENNFDFLSIQDEMIKSSSFASTCPKSPLNQSKSFIKRKDKKDLLHADLIWKNHFESYQNQTDLDKNLMRKKVKKNFIFDDDTNTTITATNEITEEDKKYMRKCKPSLLINTTKLVELIYETHFSEYSNTEPFELCTNKSSKKIKIQTKKLDKKSN